MENHDDYLNDLLKQFILPTLPDCEILSGNVEYLCKLFLKNIEPGSNPKNVHTRFLSMIDLYGEPLNYIFQKNEIDNIDDTYPLLQQAGASYIFILMLKSMGISIDGIKKRLREIEKTSAKLIKLLEFDKESVLFLAAIASSELNNIMKKEREQTLTNLAELEMFTVRLLNLPKELQQLTQANLMFAESPIAKWLQFGKSGPKENSALNMWVRFLSEIWVDTLNRELSFSNNSHSGREKFLSFAEDCIAIIHPNIGVDAVRNAYEKLRSKGTLDYLYPIVE